MRGEMELEESRMLRREERRNGGRREGKTGEENMC